MYIFPEQDGVSRYVRKLLMIIALMAPLAFTACTALGPCPGYSPAEQAAGHVPKSTLSGLQQARYEYVQKRISTNKEFFYHDAVVEPGSFRTPYSFYLLGFEKPRDKHSAKPYCRMNEAPCSTPQFDPHKFTGGQDDDPGEIADTRNDIEKNLFQDPRPLVLTHVLNVGKGALDIRSSDQQGCFVFNVYGHDSETPWCKNHYRADIDGPAWKREGWKGLATLAADIKERAVEERTTHIVLLATGWNTRQYESYLDFLAWMNEITADFNKQREEFRPIFLGTAWESEWPWWEHIPFISEFTKGNDADEIGFTWENYLLNDLVKPIAKSTGAKVIVLGHSFGSRIALGAHYARHVLDRSAPVAEAPLTIVGMQAAFPIARFVTSGGKEHQYVATNKGHANVVLTSSTYDEATGKMCIGTAYVGAGCGLRELKHNKAYDNIVAVLTARDNGEPAAHPDAQRVTVYDVSSFVNCELKGTRSGAHSDVYDDAMGHFLGEIIRGPASGK